ncbi:MAG: MBL fold metallo-hydrolase [Coprobacillus sp.]|nr:MBL fold metallo-hydrolase [Coprobacillus sp.]
MTILRYLGHSSFLLDSESSTLVIDPYKDGSVPGLTFPKGIVCDAVVTSHNHDDHNAIDQVLLTGLDIDFTYEEIPCYHDNQKGALRGPNKIFIFYINGLKIVHLGDLGHALDKETIEKLKGCDVLLAPINGHFTLGADAIYDLVCQVEPKITVPMHYYRMEDNSGYPDGGQIETFLKHFDRVKEVHDSFVVEEEIGFTDVIIFK